MEEKTTAPTAAPAAPAEPSSALANIFASGEAPMAFVHGGTTTTAWDNEMARRSLDADRRRAEQDARAAKARASAQAQDPTEVARLSSLKLGGQQNHPVVVLELRAPDNSVQDWAVCELNFMGGAITGPNPIPGQPAPAAAEDGEFSLIVPCPRCILTRGKHPQWSQMTIRSTNKRIYFRPGVVPKWMGSVKPLWIDPTDGQPYQVAGTVDIDEVCKCDAEGCGFRFKIDDSRLIPM